MDRGESTWCLIMLLSLLDTPLFDWTKWQRQVMRQQTGLITNQIMPNIASNWPTFCSTAFKISSVFAVNVVIDKSDAAWYLLPYQLEQGFPSIITSHIRKGIEIVKKDENSLLLFSGGQTRRDTGKSYVLLVRICLVLQWFHESNCMDIIFLSEMAVTDNQYASQWERTWELQNW